MIVRTLFLTAGFLSLGLGVLGAFLPILPTTPFVLLAAFCFSKGSRRMHAWLLQSPFFGPMIQDWEEGGVIRPAAKRLATLFIVVSFTALTVFRPAPLGIIIALDIVGCLVLAFIWSRPSAKVDSHGETKWPST